MSSNKKISDPHEHGGGLRDHLAADRTVMANERTFLAYVRTSLTFFIAGATFIRFFDSLTLEVVGWAFIPVSFLVMVIGVVSFRRGKRVIHRSVCEEDSVPGESDGAGASIGKEKES